MQSSVLVVDDSALIRMQVRRSLEAIGLRVVEAVDGFDALEKLGCAATFSLVVSDVHMPRMDGLMLLESLRKIDKLARLPVVMLTTEAQPELLMRARDLGAKGWLIKPFKGDLLVAAVQKLLRGSEPSIAAAVRHEDSGR